MTELSTMQRRALLLLKTKSLRKNSYKIHNNTMVALQKKGLVQLEEFPNGVFWTTTVKGVNQLSELDSDKTRIMIDFEITQDYKIKNELSLLCLLAKNVDNSNQTYMENKDIAAALGINTASVSMKIANLSNNGYITTSYKKGKGIMGSKRLISLTKRILKA